MADTNTSSLLEENYAQEEQWLSIGDAAERLSVSRDTLRRWEKVGKIKVYRSPTDRRQYKLSELEKLYQSQNFKGGTPPSKTPTTREPITEKPITPSAPDNTDHLTNDTETEVTPSQIEDNTDPFPANSIIQTSNNQPYRPPTAVPDSLPESNLRSNNHWPPLDIPAIPLTPENSPQSEIMSPLSSRPSPLTAEPLTPKDTNIDSIQTPIDSNHQTIPNLITNRTNFITSSTSFKNATDLPEQTNVLKTIAISLAIILIIIGFIITFLIFV